MVTGITTADAETGATGNVEVRVDSGVVVSGPPDKTDAAKPINPPTQVVSPAPYYSSYRPAEWWEIDDSTEAGKKKAKRIAFWLALVCNIFRSLGAGFSFFFVTTSFFDALDNVVAFGIAAAFGKFTGAMFQYQKALEDLFYKKLTRQKVETASIQIDVDVFKEKRKKRPFLKRAFSWIVDPNPHSSEELRFNGFTTFIKWCGALIGEGITTLAGTQKTLEKQFPIPAGLSWVTWLIAGVLTFFTFIVGLGLARTKIKEKAKLADTLIEDTKLLAESIKQRKAMVKELADELSLKWSDVTTLSEDEKKALARDLAILENQILRLHTDSRLLCQIEDEIYEKHSDIASRILKENLPAFCKEGEEEAQTLNPFMRTLLDDVQKYEQDPAFLRREQYARRFGKVFGYSCTTLRTVGLFAITAFSIASLFTGNPIVGVIVAGIVAALIFAGFRSNASVRLYNDELVNLFVKVGYWVYDHLHFPLAQKWHAWRTHRTGISYQPLLSEDTLASQARAKKVLALSDDPLPRLSAAEREAAHASKNKHHLKEVGHTLWNGTWNWLLGSWQAASEAISMAVSTIGLPTKILGLVLALFTALGQVSTFVFPAWVAPVFVGIAAAVGVTTFFCMRGMPVEKIMQSVGYDHHKARKLVRNLNDKNTSTHRLLMKVYKSVIERKEELQTDREVNRPVATKEGDITLSYYHGSGDKIGKQDVELATLKEANATFFSEVGKMNSRGLMSEGKTGESLQSLSEKLVNRALREKGTTLQAQAETFCRAAPAA